MSVTNENEKNEILKKLKKILYESNDSILWGNGTLDCTEVYPNLYISDGESAKNKGFLRTLGITHVLNAAEGKGSGLVDTGEDFYSDSNIKYLGLFLLDLPQTQISYFFYRIADFIEDGLNSGGKVLVHCVMGISRSSTCVIAFLIIKKGFTVYDAITEVRKYRSIIPNTGFLNQLLDLESNLKQS